MNNSNKVAISHYKVLSLSNNLEKNSVYYLLDQNSNIVSGYITDLQGNPIPLFTSNAGGSGKVESVTGTGVTGTAIDPKIDISTFVSNQLGNLVHLSVEDGKLLVSPLVSHDSSIEIVTTTGETQIQLAASIQGVINSSLQPGDNISELNNDIGYITINQVPVSYTDEKAQDAVGNIILDTSTIDLTYDDNAPSISANIKSNSITANELSDTINTSEFVNNGDGTSSYVTEDYLNSVVIGVGDMTKAVYDTNNNGVVDSSERLNTARNINGVPFNGTTDITINAVDSTPRIAVSEKGAPNGVSTLDSSGFVLLSQVPPSIIERLIIVADQTARFALTTSVAQNGDTVKQVDTNVMYYVKDDTNLNSELGYEIYRAGTAASVPWSGVTNTPTTLAGYGITDASSASLFTQDIPVVLSSGKTLGKYITGQTIPAIGKSAEQVLRDIALEYVFPTFTSFSVSGQATAIEVGTTLSGSKTFTWGITQNSGVVATIDIFNNTTSSTLLAATPNDGSQSQTITTVTLNTDGATQSWKGIANNTSPTGTINSSNFIVTSRFLRFWSPVSAFPSNLSDGAANRTYALALTNAFKTPGANTFTLSTGTTNNKFIVLLPPGVTITSVVDQTNANTEVTANYILSTITINDASGTARTYNMYQYTTAITYTVSANHFITTT